MYTVREIAERLNVSESNVYALVRSGRLGCYRIGNGRGAIRISEQTLQRYLNGCCQQEGVKPKTTPRPRLKHIRL
jgi:excisionase family DNA binding protein